MATTKIKPQLDSKENLMKVIEKFVKENKNPHWDADLGTIGALYELLVHNSSLKMPKGYEIELVDKLSAPVGGEKTWFVVKIKHDSFYSRDIVFTGWHSSYEYPEWDSDFKFVSQQAIKLNVWMTEDGKVV